MVELLLGRTGVTRENLIEMAAPAKRAVVAIEIVSDIM